MPMTPADHFDLIVIGSGPAGGRCAVRCAKAGRRVAIVESRGLGGTCALRGCNPKKVYTNAAALLDAARRNDGHLIAGGDGPRIDWPALLHFKEEFTDPVPARSQEKFESHRIHTVQGEAVFAGPNRIRVGDRTLRAVHILLAVGSRPAPLKIPGQQHVRTSDEFLNLPDLPQRVVFIGGGYISFEFAHVAARAGREVTILDRHPRPLEPFDAWLVEKLCDRTQGLGIALHRSTSLHAIEQSEDGAFIVHAQGPNGPLSLPADLVVHGAGRVPNLHGLNLDAAGIEATAAGVTVDAYLRSVSNSAVFAAGDCAATGRPPLTPAADADGDAVATTLLTGRSTAVATAPIPSVVFTTPPLASVGLTVAQADETHIPYTLRQADLSSHGAWRKVGEPCGGSRVLIDPASDRILGAHLLGPAAEEVINLFALAMASNIPATRLRDLPLAYPTFTAEYAAMSSDDA